MVASTPFQNFSSSSDVFSGRPISDMPTPSDLDQKQRSNCQYRLVSLLALAAMASKAGRRKSSSACLRRRRMTPKSGVRRICLGVGAGGSSSGEGSFALRTWSLMKSAACPRKNSSNRRIKPHRVVRAAGRQRSFPGSCCQQPCSLCVSNPPRSDSGLAHAPQSGDVRRSSVNQRHESQSGRASRRPCHLRWPTGSQSAGSFRQTSHNCSSLGFPACISSSHSSVILASFPGAQRMP